MKRLVYLLFLISLTAFAMEESHTTCLYCEKEILLPHTSQSADQLQLNHHHPRCWQTKKKIVHELVNHSFSDNDCRATVNEENRADVEEVGE